LFERVEVRFRFVQIPAYVITLDGVEHLLLKHKDDPPRFTKGVRFCRLVQHLLRVNFSFIYNRQKFKDIKEHI